MAGESPKKRIPAPGGNVCALITDPYLRAMCEVGTVIYGGKKYDTPPKDILTQCMQSLVAQGVSLRAAGGQCVRAWDNGAGVDNMPGVTPPKKTGPVQRPGTPTPERPGDRPFTGGPVAGRDYGYGSQPGSLPHISDLNRGTGVLLGVMAPTPAEWALRKGRLAADAAERARAYRLAQMVRTPKPPIRPPANVLRGAAQVAELATRALGLGIGGVLFPSPIAAENVLNDQRIRHAKELILSGAIGRKRVSVPGIAESPALGRNSATLGTVRSTPAGRRATTGSPHLPSATPSAVPSAVQVAIPGTDILEPVRVTGSRATSAPPRAAKPKAVRGSLIGSIAAGLKGKLNILDMFDVLRLVKGGRNVDPITIRNVIENTTTPGSRPEPGSGFAPTFGGGQGQCNCDKPTRPRKRKARNVCGRGTFVETRSGLRKTYSGGKHPCP